MHWSSETYVPEKGYYLKMLQLTKQSIVYTLNMHTWLYKVLMMSLLLFSPDFILSADVVKDKSHVMYEGKHIHFSEVDNKPLCSYSPKLCKQRRLNGYAFCIRHVLEDKTAPFKQCEYVAKYNSQRCTNPIPKSEDRRWVNSSLPNPDLNCTEWSSAGLVSCGWYLANSHVIGDNVERL